MFKILNNEKGYAIVVAICVLAILTLGGASMIQMSITEQRISTNYQIHKMNFYAAESGIAIGPLWASAEVNYPESEWSNINFVGNSDGSLSNGTAYDFNVYPITLVDPSDGNIKVLRYGDVDGDYLNEINYTTGPPLIKVISDGTHVGRGGLARIEAKFIFSPIFMMPDAALRVNSNVNGNGVSGSILGEGEVGSTCGPVADIMYDIAGGTIEYGGDLGDDPLIVQSSGMYPIPLIKPVILKRATMKIVGSNNIDEGAIVTSSENPGVIYISGDSKTTNLSGHGILFVDGNFEFAGSLDWIGIIIVTGNITLSGGGTKTIYGAVIAGGDAVAINGGVDIVYDCDALSELHDNFSGYRMTAWRQI
jgi:hypothetical protein